MAEVNSSLFLITLNVNGLNPPIKRQRLMVRKKKWPQCLLSRRQSHYIQRHKWVEIERMWTDIPCKQ